jgi:hypothetical protein
VSAMEECFAEAERQMRALPCAEVAADEDLGWTFERGDKWTVYVTLEGEVERRDGHLLVPLMCQARRGLGLRGHDGTRFGGRSS